MTRALRALTALACVVVLVLAGCSAHRDDPHAYPDSRDEPLDRTLAKFSLSLPPCDLSEFRYFATDDLAGGFFFRATVPASCADRYVTDLGLDADPGAKVGVSFIGQYETEKFGWHFDEPNPCTCYQRYDAASEVRVSLDIAGTGDTRTLYLSATRTT